MQMVGAWLRAIIVFKDFTVYLTSDVNELCLAVL